MTEVCVDASLAIKVVVIEAGSDKADALFEQWANEETQLIAPVFVKMGSLVLLMRLINESDELRNDLLWRFLHQPVSRSLDDDSGHIHVNNACLLD